MTVEDDRKRSGDSRTDGAVAVDLGPDDLLEPVAGATLNSREDLERLASMVGETVPELPPLPSDITLVPASSLRPVTRPSSIPKPLKKPRSPQPVPLREMAPPGAGARKVVAPAADRPRESSLLGLGLVGVLVVAGSVAFVLYERDARQRREVKSTSLPTEAVDEPIVDEPTVDEPTVDESVKQAPEPPAEEPGAEVAPDDTPLAVGQPVGHPATPAAPDDDEPILILDSPAGKRPRPAVTPPSPPPEESEPSPEAIAAAQSDACKDFRRAASLAREAGDWKAMAAALEHGECWPAKDVLADLRKRANTELARQGSGAGE